MSAQDEWQRHERAVERMHERARLAMFRQTAREVLIVAAIMVGFGLTLAYATSSCKEGPKEGPAAAGPAE